MTGCAEPEWREDVPKLLAALAGGRLRWIAALAIVAVAAFAILRFADGALLREGLGELARRPHLPALLAVCYAGAFALRAAAWRLLLGGAGAAAGGARLFAILHAALLANHALPFKAGEALRPVLAARAGVPAAGAAVTTVVARLLDLAALLCIAAALLPLTAGGPAPAAFAVPALLLAAAAAALLLLRASRPGGGAPGAIGRLRARAAEALRALPPRAVLGAFALTVPGWLLESAVVWGAAQALGIDLPLPAAAAVTAFTILFQTVHLTPGGIGVYEASMTAALQAQDVPGGEAVTLAVLAHGLKFAYSFAAGGPLALAAFGGAPSLLGRVRGGRDGAKAAGRFEIAAARLWNVLNEGKPFTPVFALGVLLLLALPLLADGGGYAPRLLAALAALTPLFALFWRYDFPLRLRAALWALLAACLVLFRPFDPAAVALVVALYLGFTVVLWGTIYYRLRIGTPWTNGLRFWKLVLENPDTTSGNFLEQVPKLLILVLLARWLAGGLSLPAVAAVEAYAAGAAVLAVLVHQWWFTWAPPEPLTPTRLRHPGGPAPSRRVVLVVVDGCRADRFAEARTPFLDRLAAEGLVCEDMRTVYPARTVTAFTSMLTGAVPRAHGMRSNFVPRLGAKCESIFDVLAARGERGRLVGIAHLVDAFGEDSVRTVTAVTPNEEIDEALAARARDVLRTEDPALLVLQTLSVDQTGHARGSYYPEYLERIEATDRLLESFLGWCGDEGYLDGATVVVTADHGQGRGIGGHGHFAEPERRVPFLAWGAGVPRGARVEGERSLLDVAPTLAWSLGAPPPERSVGQVLWTPEGPAERGAGPLAVVIPAHDEAPRLPEVLARIPRDRLGDAVAVVVDDGSEDGTAEAAERAGAEIVVRHETNRGLGAALRTGLETARRLDARAAVYIDADLEYDPAEIPALLAPIEAGEADYVLGSRFLGSREGHSFLRSSGNRTFTLALSFLAGRRITDGQTGFRAFSRRALETAEIVHDYNYAQVLTLDLLRKGMRLAEAPISYRGRTGGRSFIGGRYLWRVPLGMAREVLGGRP